VRVGAAPRRADRQARSQAIKANGFVFVSGTLGLHPRTGEMVGPTDIRAQTEQVLSNMKAVLEKADSSFEHVVKTTVLLKNMGDYKTVNEIYAKYFTTAPPARAAFAVAALPRDALVEIEAVALSKK
jgi:2-iminobutanoate/2-iminopropanoate deaminase